MTPVRKAILEKRKELADRAIVLDRQWKSVRDEQAARRTELNTVELDIAQLDTWLVANPEVP